MAAAAWLIAAAGARAQAPTDDASASHGDLQFNGFGTVAAVGVRSPDDWGFRRELTQPAWPDRELSFGQDTRLGLQADWRPSSQFEFVGQVLLKPRPPQQSAPESITEAFGAWRPDGNWTIRLGRTSPDLFLLADSRNVGFSYPWMRPNVEFYGWVPVRSVDGIDATREWFFGDTRWRAKLFDGRSMVTFSDTDNYPDRARIRSFGGGTLTLDSGPWTVKATVVRADTRPLDEADIQLERSALDQVAQLPIPLVAAQAATLRNSFPAGVFVTRYSALGAIWNTSPWQVQAEIARIDGNFDAGKDWYGYASVARRVGDASTVYVMAGRAHSTRAPLPQPQWTAALTPVVGPVLAAEAQSAASTVADTTNDGRIDQHSVSVGLRYDLASQIALKAELDAVQCAPFGGGLWSFNSPGAHHALVTSVGMDFIF